MEICIDLDDDYETDVEIDFSKFSHTEKEKILSALKKGKKYIFTNITIKVTGEFCHDIDIEPMYNEGYC